MHLNQGLSARNRNFFQSAIFRFSMSREPAARWTLPNGCRCMVLFTEAGERKFKVIDPGE